MSDFLLLSNWGPTEEAGHETRHSSHGAQPYHEQSTMEGSEFMDDSLRMTEQLLDPNEAELL